MYNCDDQSYLLKGKSYENKIKVVCTTKHGVSQSVVLALMFKACKFSLFDSKSTDDLYQDDDEQPYLS